MNTMFDTILQLPLFQGLTQEDFTNIVGKVKLHFTKHKPGEILAQAGETCDRLLFILKGEMSVRTSASDASYIFTEYLQGPCLIEPQSLFGMNTCYASTYTTQNETHAVCISKSFVLNELFKYDIFRLNYLNIVSNRAQIFYNRLWATAPEDTEERISRFILQHAERPQGRKELKIKMEVLAHNVNETRLAISKALNTMQEKGIVELHRGEVVVPQAERLP